MGKTKTMPNVEQPEEEVVAQNETTLEQKIEGMELRNVQLVLENSRLSAEYSKLESQFLALRHEKLTEQAKSEFPSLFNPAQA